MEFVMKIGAQAGAGVMVTGKMAAKCFTRGNYNVVGYPEYPSLVRGGHNVYQLVVSDKPVRSPRKRTHVVLALNRDAVFYHKDFLAEKSAIIYDKSLDISDLKVPKNVRLFPLPVKEILDKAGGTPRMANTVMLAAAFALVDYPFEIVSGVLGDEFKRKGGKIVSGNINAAKAGYDFIKQKSSEFPLSMSPLSEKRKLLLGGNEAIALGAVSAGMKFYSAYPMTPASTILHYLYAHERDFDIIVKQTEDEIAAMNYTIGAAYAGVRAMTGTSGGGFSLMVEALGLAALSETPVVVALVQRTGPSTGMPTWTEAADLKFALNASQGDFPRIILAPGNVGDAYYLSSEAFNLAEKYQLPVIIISDKFLSESIFSAERFDQDRIKTDRGKIEKNPPKLEPNTRFPRYRITKDGVSPRTFPGTPDGMHVGTSYEHDESGFSSESFSNRKEQVDKRARKVNHILKEFPKPKLYGEKDAEVTIVSWGSMKLPALDAVEMLKERGIRANVLNFTYLFPLDRDAVLEIFKKCRKTVMIENNSTGQFAGILREYCEASPDFLILRYDGRPFYAEQLADEIEKLHKADFKGERIIRPAETEDLEYYAPYRYGL